MKHVCAKVGLAIDAAVAEMVAREIEQDKSVHDGLTMSSDPDLSASCLAKSFLSFSMSFFV